MPSPTLGVSWNVEGEHRPAPQIEENSNKGGVRGGGEGMEEESRAVASHWLDGPWERRFRNTITLHHYYPHFPDEEGEAQKGRAHPGSHDQ